MIRILTKKNSKVLPNALNDLVAKMVDSCVPVSRFRERFEVTQTKFRRDDGNGFLEDQDTCFLPGIIHNLRRKQIRCMKKNFLAKQFETVFVDDLW
jgi:hypothetical protein